MQLEQNLDLYVEPYKFEVTKRQNFCGLQAKVDADEVDLRTVLSGKYLNIAIMRGKWRLQRTLLKILFHNSVYSLQFLLPFSNDVK